MAQDIWRLGAHQGNALRGLFGAHERLLRARDGVSRADVTLRREP
jgi:hypothetical protein